MFQAIENFVNAFFFRIFVPRDTAKIEEQPHIDTDSEEEEEFILNDTDYNSD